MIHKTMPVIIIIFFWAYIVCICLYSSLWNGLLIFKYSIFQRPSSRSPSRLLEELNAGSGAVQVGGLGD